MIKRMIIRLGIAFFLIWGQVASAGASGLLFNVSATGTPADVSITLCLNGNGPLSCQNYNISALTLSISTAVPNHVYPFTGIKINTPGYTLGNLGLDCTPNDNGYCLFAVSDSQAKTISLVVNSGLSVTPTTLPQATINTFYSQTVTASGGIAPYTYAISVGLLPTGLSLNTSTGVISGTPTLDSTSAFTVTASDSNYPSASVGSQAYSVVVSGPLTLTPTTLPAGTISTAYSQTITVDSIVTPISYAVSSGTLPIGLSLNPSTGVISGTPTTDGTYPFTITATDAGGNTGSRGYSIIVVTFIGSNTTSFPINDYETIDSPINVSSSLTVSSVVVVIDNLIHTYDDDLVISLVAPTGAVISLSNRNGSSGNNYINTNFSMSATTPITNGSAPFTGEFIPQGNLNSLNGINASGTWFLRISDVAGADTGALNAWTLMIN